MSSSFKCIKFLVFRIIVHLRGLERIYDDLEIIVINIIVNLYITYIAV